MPDNEFIPPMLATKLRDPALLDEPRYVAEPKLDGQRAQVHVEDGRTVACYSRPGRELLGLGLRWLTAIRWLAAPPESAVSFSSRGARVAPRTDRRS